MTTNLSPLPCIGDRIFACVRDGIRRGLRMTLWLLRFLIPISFGVAALQYLGVLPVLARWAEPLFRATGLPGQSSVPFITGALLNIYSGIATMTAVPLTQRELTILALMMLISHNLPIEGVVQHKAGANGARMVILRLGTSFMAAVLLNAIIPLEWGAQVVTGNAVARTTGLAGRLIAWLVTALQASGIGEQLIGWLVATTFLTLRIALCVMGVMVLQRLLDEFGITNRLARLLAVPLAALGLPRKTAFLWVVANTLGLAYGAAVIVEETQRGEMTRDETRCLNLSIGICHSLLEDTALFAAIGVGVGWITAPRLILAAVVVWGWRALRRLYPDRAQ